MGTLGTKLVGLFGEVMEPSGGGASLEEVGTVIGRPHFLSQLSASVYQDVTNNTASSCCHSPSPSHHTFATMVGHLEL